MLLGLAVTAVAEERKPIKVGVCIYQFNDNFMTLYRTELEKYLKETYNADVTVVDGKNDQTEQTNQINSFIAEGVDVLIVNLVQSTSAATVIDLVEATGIPTVFINREPSEEDMENGRVRLPTLAPMRVSPVLSRVKSSPPLRTRVISTATARWTT